MTNVINSRIGIISLPEEQTIGATINWYLTHNPVPTEALAAAFEANGLDSGKLPEPTSGNARFRTLCVRLNERIYRRLPSGGRREFVVAQVKHTGEDKHLNSYAYSANFGNGTEKAKLVQVGTLTFDKKNDTFSWRFANDRINPGEQLSEYIARSVADFDGTGVVAEDLGFFAEFSHRILEEVEVYANGSFYDIARLRNILRDRFNDAGAFTLSARGGFWFAPRFDGTCPFDECSKVMRSFEQVDPNNRFLLLTMPKDEQTVETAASVVEEGLLSRVEDVIAALDKVEEMKRAGQHDSRLAELTDLIAKADLYSELLGMATDSLRLRVEDARATIAAQVAAYEVELAERKAEKEAEKNSVPEVDLDDLSPVAKARATDIREAVRSGSATFDHISVEVAKDHTLGYQWRLVSTNGSILAQGSATSQKAVIDAIREAASN